MKKDKVLLWLDDLRNPYENEEGLLPKVEDCHIIWVKNFNEFKIWIELYPQPTYISFDHDLAPEHYTPEEYWNDYEVSKKYQEAQTYTEKTGEDCAKLLVELCKERGLKIPQWFVHSRNPVGADKIRNVLINSL